MKSLFQGTGTALVTPFCDGAVDWDALERLVEDQIAGGVKALIAAGTTGEPASMTHEEHMQVIRFVARKARDRVCVIAGTGSNCTHTVIENAKELADAGVDAQLVVTPYYNKPSQAGLVAHYHEIADHSSLPVIVYNVPSRTGLNMLPETLQKITEHPGIVAVKEANADVVQAMQKVALCGHQVAFYSGSDELAVPLMVMGFQGLISVVSNVLPSETSRMTDLALAGRWQEAAAMQQRLLPLMRALMTTDTNPIPCKAAMAMLGKCRDELRLPLVPMQPNNRAVLEKVMREMQLI